jgi:hypothetical protein
MEEPGVIDLGIIILFFWTTLGFMPESQRAILGRATIDGQNILGRHVGLE